MNIILPGGIAFEYDSVIDLFDLLAACNDFIKEIYREDITSNLMKAASFRLASKTTACVAQELLDLLPLNLLEKGGEGE